MYYYQDGQYIINGQIRWKIVKSAEAIDGETPMDADEAQTLLTQYSNADTVIECKRKLAETDYVSCKIAEGSATIAEYAEVIAQRQAWRNTINQLEG